MQEKQKVSLDLQAEPDETHEWPFEWVSQEDFWSLPEADRAGLEQIIRDMIEKKNSKH